MAGTVHAPPCPRCGEPVSVTLGAAETGDQLAADHADCPACGAHLERAIDGHADRGWRLDEE